MKRELAFWIFVCVLVFSGKASYAQLDFEKKKLDVRGLMHTHQGLGEHLGFGLNYQINLNKFFGFKYDFAFGKNYGYMSLGSIGLLFYTIMKASEGDNSLENAGYRLMFLVMAAESMYGNVYVKRQVYFSPYVSLLRLSFVRDPESGTLDMFTKGVAGCSLNSEIRRNVNLSVFVEGAMLYNPLGKVGVNAGAGIGWIFGGGDD